MPARRPKISPGEPKTRPGRPKTPQIPPQDTRGASGHNSGYGSGQRRQSNRPGSRTWDCICGKRGNKASSTTCSGCNSFWKDCIATDGRQRAESPWQGYRGSKGKGKGAKGGPNTDGGKDSPQRSEQGKKVGAMRRTLEDMRRELDPNDADGKQLIDKFATKLQLEESKWDEERGVPVAQEEADRHLKDLQARLAQVEQRQSALAAVKSTLQAKIVEQQAKVDAIKSRASAAPKAAAEAVTTDLNNMEALFQKALASATPEMKEELAAAVAKTKGSIQAMTSTVEAGGIKRKTQE